MLSYVPYDHRHLIFLTSDSVYVYEGLCSNWKKISILVFICGQISAIMDKNCWPSIISEIGRMTTHFVGNFVLIKIQVRTQGEKWQKLYIGSVAHAKVLWLHNLSRQQIIVNFEINTNQCWNGYFLKRFKSNTTLFRYHGLVLKKK